MPAKKSDKKHDPHKAAKDARRTFEHQGRVQAMASLTNAEQETLTLLTTLSARAFQHGHYKDSADLLRAAEHLSFAMLHADAQETVAPDLRKAILDELAHLAERTAEHKSHQETPREVQPLLTRFIREAEHAQDRRSYRAALEFGRGAEALAHVHNLGEKALTAPAARLRA